MTNIYFIKPTGFLFIFVFVFLFNGYSYAEFKHLTPGDNKKSSVLEEYVNEPDIIFNFAPVTVVNGPGFNLHILNLKSQQWRMPNEVNRTVWEHDMLIIVPNIVNYSTSMMLVGGGDNGVPPDLNSNEIAVAVSIAVATGTVVTIIRQVPNQPLIFNDEPGSPKREDELVAFTFDKAMRTGDYIWPAYLPMVKSVVKAMDAVQSFIYTESNGDTTIKNFVVTGFSKRGVTAWLTAVVDPRVVAIAPGVYDSLNITKVIENHRASYGEFSNALNDFENYDIFDRFRIPEGEDLRNIIDPFSYLDSLTLPKYILNASGDQLYPSDSSLFYANALLGETLFRYVPNTDHSGINGGLTKAFTGLLSWYQRILSGLPHPEIHWTIKDGLLRVTTDIAPIQVLLWQATNPVNRDFRFEKVGPIWFSIPLDASSTEYSVAVNAPPIGWSGYFLEFTFSGVAGIPEVYSTPIFVSPEELPFSLAQPINNPRNTRFWAQEFSSAIGDDLNYTPVYDAGTLSSFLPIRVFNNYVTTLEEANQALNSMNHPGTEKEAIRRCLATRLNVESEEIDWYSSIRFSYRKHLFLWKQWNLAHFWFLFGHPGISKTICRNVNSMH